MEGFNLYSDEGSEKIERGKKQDKQFCLGMGSGATNTFRVMVVVE